MIRKVTKEDSKVVWQKMFMLDKPKDFPVPEEVVDVAKLHLIMTSFLYPAASVGHYGFTLS